MNCYTYILVDKVPMKEPDMLVWGVFMSGKIRFLFNDIVDDVRISTVFLGVDHSYGGGGPPILFETMVFGGPLDGEFDRCSTWEKAVEMHAQMRLRAIDSKGNSEQDKR